MNDFIGNTEGRKIGVIVAHGVGETEAGQCVSTLAGTLKAAGVAIDDDTTVCHLRDALSSRPDAVFPVHTRRARLASGERLVLSEFFWSDLTRLKPGVLNAMFGLFRVIFEAHHIVDAMLGRGGDRVTKLLRHLLLILSWALRGPIAGLTTALIATCAVMLFMSTNFADFMAVWIARIGLDRWQVDSIGLMFFLVNLSVLFVAYLLRRNRRAAKDATWEDTISWIMLVAIFILVLQAAGLFLQIGDILQAIDGVIEKIRGTKFVLIHACDINTLKSLAPFNPPDCARSDYINTMYGLVKTAWILWGLLVGFAFALYGAQVVRWLWAKLTRSRFVLAPSSAAIGVIILQFMLWSALVVPAAMPILNRATLLELLSRPEVWSNLGEQKQRYVAVSLGWVDRLTGSYAITLAGIVLTVIVALLIVLLRRLVARTCTARLERADRLMPRLLFSKWVMAALFLFAAVQIMYVGNLFGRIGALFVLAGDVVPLMTEAGRYLGDLQPDRQSNVFLTVLWPEIKVSLGVIAFLSALFIGRGFTNGVHIARDLIDYQYRVAPDAAAAPQPRAPLPGMAGARRAFQFLRLRDRPRRERMLKRLTDVVDHTLRDDGFDQVILVAHSQGTVIVFDYLEEASGPLLRRFRPSVLTFGSPLEHLYGHYYRDFADLDVKLRQQQGRIERWINIFRIDDYIGRRIGAPAELIDNRPIERGGHTRYWTEPLVAQALIELATGKGPAAQAGTTPPTNADTPSAPGAA